MTYSNKMLARAFFESAHGKTAEELSVRVKNFLLFLRKKRLTKKIPYILHRVQTLEDAAHKRLRLRIVSAHTLSTKEGKIIEEDMKKKYHLKEVVIEQSTDPDLIAGVTLRVGFEIIDNSVQGKLSTLKEQIV